MPHGMWDLISPTRDWTSATCSGSAVSYPLDCWGSSPECPFWCILPLYLTYSISFIFFYIVSNHLPPDTYKLKGKLVILEWRNLVNTNFTKWWQLISLVMEQTNIWEGCSIAFTVSLRCAAVLSYFSCVWLRVTPGTAARQAPLSIGFPRREYWDGLPCSPPGDLSYPGIEPASLVSCIDRWFLYHYRHPGSAIVSLLMA